MRESRRQGVLQKGSSTLEILIAFAILVISITAIMPVAFSNQSVTIDTDITSEALLKAQALLEQTRASSRESFSGLMSTAAASEQSGPLTFTKKLDVVDVDASTKEAKGTISWTQAGRNLSVSLSTIFTNFGNVSSKCSQAITGDWTAPEVYGYVDFPSSEGATSVRIKGSVAFITSDPSSSGTDDFYAINISNPSPQKGSLPVLDSFSTSYGLTDIRISGNYAFVSANSQAFELLVIDIGDPSGLNPSKIKSKVSVTLPGATGVGNTLYYVNGKVYLGLTISDGPEFYIIDVSDPLTPVVQGSYEVGTSINSIIVKDQIAYLATAGDDQVLALNVSNPMTPAPWDAYSSITLTGQSLVFDNIGSKLYFGRIGGFGNPKLLAFNVGNLAIPTWEQDKDAQDGVYTMIHRGGLIFMTTADPNDGLQIWDVTNASATVPPVRHDDTPLNIQQTATAGSDCVGNLLYVAQRSNRALQIIGPQVDDIYTLSATGDVTVTAGGSGNTSVTRTVVSGFPPQNTLTLSGLPAGASATFSNNPCLPTCTSQVTIDTLFPITPPGTYPITVTGTGGVTTSFNLIVDSQLFDYALGNSGDVTIKKKESGTLTITRTLVSGQANPVTLMVTGLPQHVTVDSITQNPCAPTCSSDLTLKVGNPATAGTYPITVTGSPDGAGPRTTTFDLTVTN